MKYLYLTILAFFISGVTYSQTYDFESETTGANGTLTNGWVGSPTTGFSWSVDVGGTTSSGTGPAVDHTLGSATGKYIYTEASTPALPGDIASLTSPVINLATTANPGLSFWYHRAGTSMGNLYIDVQSGGVWTLGIDSLVGPQQNTELDPWLNKIVNLGAFSGNVTIRFRGICGSSWSSDMALDDISIVEMTPYDASLEKIVPSHFYYMIPQSQATAMDFSAVVHNSGADTITNVTVNGYVSGVTNINGTSSQLLPNQKDTISLTPSYTPSAVGAYFTYFDVSIAETDTNTFNDSLDYVFEINDTIYSRENDNVTQGIGFTNGSGVFGQMFEVFNTDSLTSVTFKLTGPTIGDDIKMKLYEWDSQTNLPGAIMDSTANFTIISDSNQWYTLQFTCDHILTPDKYFFAVEQIDLNNLSMGYTPEYYEPYVCFYNAGAGWVDFESAGFQVSLAIRPNFGQASWPSVDMGPDTSICAGSPITLNAPTGYASYVWSTGDNTINTTVSQADTLVITVATARGCAAHDTIIVFENPVPSVNLNPVAGICDNQPTDLVANNDPTFSYLWSNGATDSVITVSQPGTYNVTVTGANGCQNTGFTIVQNNTTPVAQINQDTLYFCQGSFSNATAAGSGNLYTWSNGTTGNPTQISQSGIFSVTVSSPFGCSDVDSAFAVEVTAPIISLSTNNVSFCQGDSVMVTVSGPANTSYMWSNGGNNASTYISSPGSYVVTATLNSCSSSDSLTATMGATPSVDIGPDTLICDTVILTLDAGGAGTYIWSSGESSQTIQVNAAGTYSVTVTNTDGCSGMDTITVTTETCLGVEELFSDMITLWPNPVRDQLFLQVDQELLGEKFHVVSITGAIMTPELTAVQNCRINVSELGSGVYYIQFKTLNRMIPFVKK